METRVSNVDPRFVLEGTRPMFLTNFSGDPNRNSGKFPSKKRKVNLIIPTEEQALDLVNAGCKVSIGVLSDEEAIILCDKGFRATNVRDRISEKRLADYVPQFYVEVRISFTVDGSKYDPFIYLSLNGSEDILQRPEDMPALDNEVYINSIKCYLNPWRNQQGGITLYVQSMYIYGSPIIVGAVDPWANA